MAQDKLETERIRLMRDLRGERYVCLLLSESLGDISEEGVREGSLPLKDSLGAFSKILGNLARSLDEAGQTLAAWERP